MSDPLGLRSIVSERRSATLNRLVALAIDKAEAETLVTELAQLDDMLASIGKEGVGRFAQFQRPIDAVVAYLEEHGHPSTEEQISEALRKGLFRGGGPGTRMLVHKSITVFLNIADRQNPPGHANGSTRIKERNGLIGLIEWPEEMFL